MSATKIQQPVYKVYEVSGREAGRSSFLLVQLGVVGSAAKACFPIENTFRCGVARLHWTHG